MLKFLKTKLVPVLLAGALAATIVPSAMLAFSDNESSSSAATEETAETSETAETAEITAEEAEEADVEATDAVFAVYNNDGETVEGCVYDYDTGLAYIPKDLYVVDGETYAEYIQVQFLQVTKEEVADMESSVEVSLDDGETVETGEAGVSAFSFETSVEAEAGLDTDDMIVTVNGIPTDDFSYDSATGVVTVDESSLAVQSISVKTAEDESLVSKIKNAVGGAVEEADASTKVSGMKTLGTASVTNLETSSLAGKFFKGNMDVYYTSTDSQTPPGSSTEYTYYPTSDVYSTMQDILSSDYSDIVSGSFSTFEELNGTSTSWLNFALDFKGAVFRRKSLSNDNGTWTASFATGKIEIKSVNTRAATYCGYVSKNSTKLDSTELKKYNALINSGEDADGDGVQNQWAEEAVILRVLSTITSGGTDYMIVGAITDTVGGQQGYGIFKFEIEEEDDPEVALAIYKMSSDTTDKGSALSSTEYKVATSYSSSKGTLSDQVAKVTTSKNSGTSGVRIKWKSDSITGLETGVYYIKETDVADGYTKSGYVYKLTYQIKKVTSGTHQGYYKYTVTAKRSTDSGTFRKYEDADLQFMNSKLKNAGSTTGAGTSFSI